MTSLKNKVVPLARTTFTLSAVLLFSLLLAVLLFGTGQ
jgi:hypothetical protein